MNQHTIDAMSAAIRAARMKVASTSDEQARDALIAYLSTPEVVQRERDVAALVAAATRISNDVELDCHMPDCPDCACWRPLRKALAPFQTTGEGK